MIESEGPGPDCPYCGRRLELLPNRWFGRSVLACEQCGDFPDYRTTGSADALAPAPRLRPRVLLIDDSLEHLALYASMLEGAAIVRTAPRGEEGLTLAAAEPFDAIVLDVMMPGMDGWEVCRRLKADPATARIPIVMLTSLDAVDVPARARELGAAAVLMKPCPVGRLTLVLNAAVRRSRIERSTGTSNTS